MILVFLFAAVFVIGSIVNLFSGGSGGNSGTGRSEPSGCLLGFAGGLLVGAFLVTRSVFRFFFGR